MPEWRALLDSNTSNEEPNLVDVEVGENLNPFGDYAMLAVDDHDGSRYDEYRRGRRVDVQAKADDSSSWSTELPGFVVDRRQMDEGGGTTIEIELYSLDHLLRRSDVSAPLDGQSMLSALQQLIEDDTPVAWNASNVDIVSSQEVTRGFTYQRVDDVLEEFAIMSGNEEWGVNQSGEFYFRPRESKRVSRGIDETQFFDYDIAEQSQEETNVIRSYYGSGDRLVTVSDDKSRQNLQNELGTTGPVDFVESSMNQDVDNLSDARVEGNEQLEDKSDVSEWEVVTYGLLGASPGDTIDVTVPEAGLDGEYLIAQIVYVWGMDESRFTLVDLSGNDDDFQKRIADTVKRVEMRPAVTDPDELESDVRVIETDVDGELDVTGDIGGESIIDDSIVVNVGLSKIRDGWRTETPIVPDTIAVGTDPAAPSRTATTLDDQSESVGVSVSTPSSDTVRFTNATTLSTTDDIQQVAVFDDNSDLLILARTQTPVSGPDDVTVDVQVNDSDENESVLTNTGQTLTRDILANNSPDWVTEIALGSGTTTPAEGDTALATEEVSQDVEQSLVADTVEAFRNASNNTADNQPVNVTPGGSNQIVESLRTAFTVQGENFFARGDVSTVSDGDFSGGAAAALDGETYHGRYTGYGYDIPGSNRGFAIRGRIDAASGTETVEVIWDSIPMGTVDIGTTLQWYDVPLDRFPRPINPVVSYGLRQEGSPGETVEIDMMTVYDDRYHDPTEFDNANDGSGGHLDSPQNYPSQLVVDFGDMGVDQVSSAELAVSYNESPPSNDAFLEVEGDQQDNTESASFTFAGTTSLTPKVALSNFGSSSGHPQTGAQGHSISSFELLAGLGGFSNAGINAIRASASILSGTLGGTTITEAGQKTGSGDLATRSTFAGVPISSSQQVQLVELLTWENVGRLVNEAVFDIQIANQESVAASEITGDSHVRVDITRTEVI